MSSREGAHRSAVLLSIVVLTGCASTEGDGRSAASNMERLALSAPEIIGRTSSPDGVVPLDGHRVIVADPRERAVLLLGPGPEDRTVLGHEGRGPREYVLPQAAVPVGTDSILILDLALRRFLPVRLPSLAVGEATSLPDTLWNAKPIGTDRSGRIFFEKDVDLRGRTRIGPGDSSSVFRWDPATAVVVELVRLDATDRQQQASTVATSSGTTTIRMFVPEPFSRSDEWGVLPDGRLLIVRATPFAIEVVDTTGTVERRWSPPGFEASMSNRSETPGPVAIDRSMRVSPDGIAWLGLHGRAESDSTTFLVLGPNADILGMVVLPVRQQLIALGQGYAVIGEKDQDDLSVISVIQVDYRSP